MSGGHFDYRQHTLTEMADRIQDLVDKNGQTVLRDDYFESRLYTYPEYDPEVIRKFQQAIDILREGAIMVQRIDWLVSGDDGEESFHDRWNQEITAYRLLKEIPDGDK